ncbi:MAG: MerR family transcriptional regulator [Acidimicrobiales bacterium]
MEYTVGEVAGLTGVSVRALHHYDGIGLLTPSGRSPAGYRRYSVSDLGRLRQILFYRELEFGLDEIAAMLADPTANRDDHLRRQHRLLRRRQAHVTALLGALENEMEATKMGISLTPEEQFEVFGTVDLDRYDEEVERRWGDTDAYRQSRRKAAAYTKEDWIAMKAEADANVQALAAALAAGDPASGNVACGLAEAHRQHICRWFYDCDYAMHRGLAEMYVADSRFTATYEAVAPGLAVYVHDAIVANGERAGSGAD